MSDYSLYDFTESLKQVDLNEAKAIRVVKAWGLSGDYAEWTGGFVLKLDDGRYAYLAGWCDTTGWGCQDGVEIRFARSIKGLALPTTRKADSYLGRGPIVWDENPADLNRWIKKGSPDPDSL